jgi:hypothetical protein
MFLECNKPLVFLPYTRFSALSSVPSRYRATCQPRDAFLISNKGWCARYKQGLIVYFSIKNIFFVFYSFVS